MRSTLLRPRPLTHSPGKLSSIPFTKLFPNIELDDLDPLLILYLHEEWYFWALVFKWIGAGVGGVWAGPKLVKSFSYGKLFTNHPSQYIRKKSPYQN